jgi:hypothetical protein
VELDIELQFTVCDKAASEPCPLWTGRPITSDWGLEDPAAIQGSQGSIDEQRHAFRNVLNYIMARVRLFSVLPLAKLDELTIKREMDAIGQFKEP